MNFFVSATLAVVGVIHVLPAIGLVGNEALRSLYGMTISDPSLSLLLRHRAVLFGLLGVSLIAAAFRPVIHSPALCIALLSTASFIALAYGQHGLSTEIYRIVKIDLVCVVLLLIAMTWKLAQ